MDIKKDIEYIDNQVNYLDKYHVNILKEWKRTNNFSLKWNGLEDDAIIYLQIERWLKCYNDVAKYIQKKSFSEDEINTLIGELNTLQYPKISSYHKDEITKAKRFFNNLIFPLRLLHNKKKIKTFEVAINEMGVKVYKLKKLRYKIESYYYDGI